jgi:hypothetical protein
MCDGNVVVAACRPFAHYEFNVDVINAICYDLLFSIVNECMSDYNYDSDPINFAAPNFVAGPAATRERSATAQRKDVGHC